MNDERDRHYDRQIMASFVEDIPIVALIVWLRFEVECETFERQLPGFWFRGDPKLDAWIPHDLALARRYAHEKKLDALAEIRRLEIPIELSNAAKKYAERCSFTKQKRELEGILAAFPEYANGLSYEPRLARDPVRKP